MFGQNFLAGAPLSGTSGKLRVLVGGQEAAVDTDSATDGAVSAVAPETDYSDAEALAVTVITPAGVQAWLQPGVTVRTAPTLLGVDRSTARANELVTLTGEWYGPQNAPLTILINGTSALVPQPNDKLTSNTAQFTIPQPPSAGAAATINIGVRQYGQQSADTVPWSSSAPAAV